jgi:hypothetical protein
MSTISAEWADWIRNESSLTVLIMALKPPCSGFVWTDSFEELEKI